MKPKEEPKRIRTGQPRKIATAEQDAEYSRAWNVVMVEDGVRATFAALDHDHARELADMINACAWVNVGKAGDA